MEDERVGRATTWEKTVPDRGKSQCKSGKLEAGLLCLRNRRVWDKGRARRRATGDKVTGTGLGKAV